MNKILIVLGYITHKISKLNKKAKNKYLQQMYSRKVKTLGIGVRFNGISSITGLDKIEIADNVHIGNNAFIAGEGGLNIGENVHIARNLVLYTHNHNYNGKRLPYDDSFIFKKVVIERNVWIGINVTILPGTYIKEGAIVGAGSVVSGLIEENSIYGASRAKKIKTRDKEHYLKLDSEKSFGGISGRILDYS